MRSRFIPLLAVLLVAPLARAAKPVTIAQLEQILLTDHGQSDGRVASQLANLALTERVTAERLASWQAQFSGRRTQEALLLLADESAFQTLPASGLTGDPPPGLPAEGKILAAALAYTTQTLRNLPNFLATRQTLHFEASLDRVVEQARNSAGSTMQSLGTPSLPIESVNYLPLHFIRKSSALVTYRDGREVLASHDSAVHYFGLTTNGEFGPILTVVLGDAAHSSVVWGYWQQHGDTRLAVFRYRVPVGESHYLVEYREGGLVQSYPAYHGEIAVDPATGSIFRISVVSEPVMPFEPVASGILVEYSSVILAGRAYIVPLHGVALSKVPVLPGPETPPTAVTPMQIRLNDVAFTGYRLFRAEARILTNEESMHLRGNAPAFTPPQRP
jgi:hypothetical protein